MSDPLSIAAGVVGILTAAAQISSILIKFTTTVRDAPHQARVVATEVSDVSGILSHLQSFLLGTESCDRSRISLLTVDQVVIIISGCVLTFSELEKILDELKADGMGFLSRIGWVRKETMIVGLVQRLQNHKASLSLILNILNGNTILEAKNSVDRLCTVLENCYQEMSLRVQDLELREQQRMAGVPSILKQDDNVSIKTVAEGSLQLSQNPDLGEHWHKAGISSVLEQGDNVSIKTVTEGSFSSEVGFARSGSIAGFGFMKDLEESWVYKRNRICRDTGYTPSITDVHSTTWSLFSGLSIAEISNISVLSLAITIGEVFNPVHFSQTSPDDQEDIIRSSHPLAYLEVSQELVKVEINFCIGCSETVEKDKAFKLVKSRYNIEMDTVLEFNGRSWHHNCFRCKICESIVPIKRSEACFLNTQSQPICNTCRCCRQCRIKINEEIILISKLAASLAGTKAITADSSCPVSGSFCRACFNCWRCGIKIDGPKFLEFESRYGVFCVKCGEYMIPEPKKRFERYQTYTWKCFTLLFHSPPGHSII